MRLGMSRTPVHEAIIRLQEDGLVRVLSKRGVMVCPLAPEDVREIYEVIIAIESMAAELLAALSQEERRSSPTSLKRPPREWRRLSEKNDLLAWAAADDLFHRTLVERCGNGRIRRIAQTVTDQAHRARMLTLKLRRKADADRSRRTDGSSGPFGREKSRRPTAMRGTIASAPEMNSFR